MGLEEAGRYSAINEELRREFGKVDCLGALHRGYLSHAHDPRVFPLSSFLLDDPGIGRAVEDRVMITVHEEQEWACVKRLYPGRHYVLIDDKLSILATVAPAWPAARARLLLWPRR